MVILYFFVVNKAGGLMLQRTYSDRAPRLSQNDYLHLASTFHGMQLLAAELSPNSYSSPNVFSGIKRIQGVGFSLYALSTATGLQMFVTSDSHSDKMHEFLADAYSSYSDFVMKNPFYEIDMPIRSELWDDHLKALVEKYNKITP